MLARIDLLCWRGFAIRAFVGTDLSPSLVQIDSLRWRGFISLVGADLQPTAGSPDASFGRSGSSLCSDMGQGAGMLARLPAAGRD